MKMRLSIQIDGDSANELFAVGVKDLMWFLNEKFNVNQKDVVYCVFEENLNEDEYVDTLLGKRTRLIHKDNYYRELTYQQDKGVRK